MLKNVAVRKRLCACTDNSSAVTVKRSILKVHIFRLLFVCFQTSVYTLGVFHENRNNSTVFEELLVSIVDLMDYILSGRNMKSAYISSFICMFSN